MGKTGTGIVEGLIDRRALRRWTQAARRAEGASLDDLRVLRSRARQLGRQLSRVVATAEERLMLPFSGAGAFPDGMDAEWSWRPDPWSAPASPHGLAEFSAGARFGEAAKIFHDCEMNENAVRQYRNTRDTDLAPFGVRLDVFEFQGGFLSIVVDVPVGDLGGLNSQSLVRLSTTIETEFPTKAYGRLNLKHGPNTEQFVDQIGSGPAARLDFDIGYSAVNDARIEAAWVELIFEAPRLNQITIRDLTVSCLRRAEL